MNGDSSHYAQDGTPTSYEQPDQEEQVSNFNPTIIAASQTRLITKAVEDLIVDPEDNDNAGSIGENDKFSNGRNSLTIDLELGANDNANERQKALEKEQDDAFNDTFPNPDTFYEHLFNKTGHKTRAMEDPSEYIAERIDIDEGAGIEPDLMQFDISHELHRFLEFEGDTWQERKGFLQDLRKEF